MASPVCRGLALLVLWVHTARVHALQSSAAPAVEGSGQASVTNLKKESFEIKYDGEHKLVQLPRELHNGEHASLRADVRVSHLDMKHCNNTYIRAMTFYGFWTEKFGLLHVSSGDDAPNAPIRVNTQTPQEFFKRFSDSGVEFGTDTLSMKFDDVGFHLTRVYEVQKGSYLNLRITGLKGFEDVGGILGYDDHADAARPDIMCTAAEPPAPDVSFVSQGRDAANSGGSKIELE
mmetsp:Transcript_80771/g.228794  ORF Transcript_80771/g.228794 Transcript_80771/m.228794 type:complete len:233 (-) Transcript_80771:80-778(-)